MATCWKHGDHDGWTCHKCNVEEELSKQSDAIRKKAEEDRAIHEQQDAALKELAAAREEQTKVLIAAQEEAAWQAELAAQEAVAEHERIARRAVREQRANLANAWKLESESKAERAYQLYKAGLVDKALDLARDALGEDGKTGDPGNIEAHQVAAWALTRKNDSVTAKQYYLGQIKLLNTDAYSGAPYTFYAVLQGLPDDPELLQLLASTVHLNAHHWNEPASELQVLEELFDRGLTTDSERFVTTLINRATDWRDTTLFLTLIEILIKNKCSPKLKELVGLLYTKAAKNGGQPDFRIIFDRLIDFQLLSEAQQLSNCLISKYPSLKAHACVTELNYRLNTTDDNLRQFLGGVESQQRGRILSEFQALFRKDGFFADTTDPTVRQSELLNRKTEFSPATIEKITSEIRDRYRQWVPGIGEEFRGKALSSVELPTTSGSVWLGIASAFFILACFPISFILLIVWGFRLAQRVKADKKAKLTLGETVQRERDTWRDVGVEPIEVAPIDFRTAITTEAAGIVLIAGVLLLLILLFLASGIYESAQRSSSAAAPIGQTSSDSFGPSFAGCINLLRNGTLERSLEGWKVLNFSGEARIVPSSDGAVEMIHKGLEDWNTISQEIRSRLQPGKTYILGVRYRTTDQVKIGLRFADSSLVMHSNSIIRTVSWELPLVADGNWHSETFEFAVTRDHPKSDEPMFSIIFDYNNVGTVFIDEVLIAEKQGNCG